MRKLVHVLYDSIIGSWAVYTSQGDEKRLHNTYPDRWWAVKQGTKLAADTKADLIVQRVRKRGPK